VHVLYSGQMQDYSACMMREPLSGQKVATKHE